MTTTPRAKVLRARILRLSDTDAMAPIPNGHWLLPRVYALSLSSRLRPMANFLEPLFKPMTTCSHPKAGSVFLGHCDADAACYSLTRSDCRAILRLRHRVHYLEGPSSCITFYFGEFFSNRWRPMVRCSHPKAGSVFLLGILTTRSIFLGHSDHEVFFSRPF